MAGATAVAPLLAWVPGASAGGSPVPGIDPKKIGGRLNWLGAQGYDDKKAIGAWLNAHHVSLNTGYVVSNDVWVPKLRAGGVGSLDILTPFIPYDTLLTKLGFLQPIPLEAVPNFKDLFPPFQSAARSIPSPSGSVYLVPLVWGGWDLIYNPKFVPKPPTSWFDLLEPKYKGKLSLLDDALTNFAVWVKALGFDPATMTKDQLSKVRDVLLRAKQNARAISPAFGEQADLFARGEVWATVGGFRAILKFAAAKGEKGLKVATPKEGSYSWADTYVLVKDAPHRDSGVALINEVLSPRAQAEYAQIVLSGVTNRRAVNLIPPNVRALYPYADIQRYFESAPMLPLPDLLAPSGKGNKVVFKDWLRVWNEVKAA